MECEFAFLAKTWEKDTGNGNKRTRNLKKKKQDGYNGLLFEDGWPGREKERQRGG